MRVTVSANDLPPGAEQRRVALREYFPDRAATVTARGDHLDIDLIPFPDGAHYVDSRLREGIAWWEDLTGLSLPIAAVPGARLDGEGVCLSLSDAWSIACWSRWWAAQEFPPREVVLLHVDDHRDLMSPRLRWDSGGFTDMITGSSVTISDPKSVDSAILSGAIGMGSFLVPILASGAVIHIRQLQPPGPHRLTPGRYTVRLRTIEDKLLARQGKPRLEVCCEPRLRRTRRRSTYEVGDDLCSWTDGIPYDVPVLVHVDLDYFNDRYDGDSDWSDADRRHDPSTDMALRRARDVAKAIGQLGQSVVSTTIAMSPGFCPAELWSPLTGNLLNYLPGGGAVEKTTLGDATGHAVHRERSSERDAAGSNWIKLVPGSSRMRAKYWHVYEANTRVGHVEVRDAYDAALGVHASIDVQLNKASRGRGIGAIVFRLAAEASGVSEVWAHARRSNIASRRAAQRAGYEDVPQPAKAQSLMVWRRPPSWV